MVPVPVAYQPVHTVQPMQPVYMMPYPYVVFKQVDIDSIYVQIQPTLSPGRAHFGQHNQVFFSTPSVYNIDDIEYESAVKY